MNREIKFRAWDANKKKLKSCKRQIFGQPSRCQVMEGGLIPAFLFVYFWATASPFVNYDNISFLFQTNKLPRRGGRDPILSHPHELLVIGNIYEYPELLKG